MFCKVCVWGGRVKEGGLELTKENMTGVEVGRDGRGEWCIRMPRPRRNRPELPEFFGRANYMPLGAATQGEGNRTTVTLEEAEVAKWRRKRGDRKVVVVPIETWGLEPEIGHVIVLVGSGGIWQGMLDWVEASRNVQ